MRILLILAKIGLYALLIFVVILFITSKTGVFTIRSYVVLTGSMGPTIPAGSIVFGWKLNTYHTNDIITFKQRNLDITHRIKSIKILDNKILYQTKGDANVQTDFRFISKKNVSGKIFFHVPYVRNMIILLQRLPGLIVPYFFTYAFFNDTGNSMDNTFSAASIFPTTSPTQEETANHLVISEVQIAGGVANQDFVEIYNPTSSEISLEGWRIRKKTSGGTISTLVSIGTGKSIVSHGFFLWANSQGGYDITVGADISNTNTLADNNSIELQDSSSASVDQVGWGTGTNQFFEGTIISAGPPANQSLERKAISASTPTTMSSGGQDEFRGNGLDTNNNSVDLILRSSSVPQNTQSSLESI